MKQKDLVARVLIAVALLGGTALLLHARRLKETVPDPPQLASFPSQIGPWSGRDMTIDPEILKILGPGDFLSRLYVDRAAPAPYIDFFIAYFASQQTGDTIHSPKNCLPGSGWLPMESGVLQVTSPGRPPVWANRYIIAQGDNRDLVLYWYQAHGRTTASEYWARLYLVADAIRMNRTDGALVRIITPITAKDTAETAQERAVGFARQIIPNLDSYIPR